MRGYKSDHTEREKGRRRREESRRKRKERKGEGKNVGGMRGREWREV